MPPDLQNFSVWLFYAIMVLAAVVAMAKGGAPERLGCAMILAALLFQFGLYALVPPRFAAVDLVSFPTDLLLLIGFGWLALRAKRMWPLWAAALQLISVTSHIARYIHIEINPMVYAYMKSAPTGLAIIALTIGTIGHMRRVKRFGSDPAWMDWRAIGQKSASRPSLRD